MARAATSSCKAPTSPSIGPSRRGATASAWQKTGSPASSRRPGFAPSGSRSLSPERPDFSEVAFVVAREDLGELLDRELPSFRMESGATPCRMREGAQEYERVLPEAPELLHDGRGIGFGVFQECRGAVVVEHPERGVFPESHLRETVSYTHLRAHETRHDLVCR